MKNAQKTISTIETPSYLLNLPTSFSSKEANNVWMEEEVGKEDSVVNPEVALAQWLDLYNIMSSNAFVQVLPTPAKCELQDLVFVANLGIVLHHIKDRDVVIVSNFTSPPRQGETQVGVDFFNFAGYEVHVCPFKFEGEADLKYIRDNIYIGGYGQRSTFAAYEWMEKNFGMKIIKIKMNNPKLYHFDCMFFPITSTDALLCTDEVTKEELLEIKSVIEIIPVPIEFAQNGITNSVRMHNLVLNASFITELDPILDKEDYLVERGKNQFLEDVLSDFGIETIFVNISEYMKGGALLSCLVCHLNRNSYNYELV